jgi:hypothetical protein
VGDRGESYVGDRGESYVGDRGVGDRGESYVGDRGESCNGALSLQGGVLQWCSIDRMESCNMSYRDRVKLIL